MATAQSNHRASLLAGLRTGGVRSSSLSHVPHTAAPGASFNLPRIALHNHNNHHHASFTEEPEELDNFQNNTLHDNYLYQRSNTLPQAPMTAAVDGPRFSSQQNPSSRTSNGGNPFGSGAITPQQAQAFQMQMMQMELIRLQAIQAQQYQAEVYAAQNQQQQPRKQSTPQLQLPNQQSQNWRGTNSNLPVTAGPHDLHFNVPSNNHRANQADLLRSKLGVSAAYDQPMTAALDGRFGSRNNNPEEPAELFHPNSNSSSRTTVISGGTVLGSPMSNNIQSQNTNGPSKSDSAISWRKKGGNSPAPGNRNVNPPGPTVRVTPPPEEGKAAMPKFRPQPLRFNVAVSQPLPTIAIDSSEVDADEGSSSNSSAPATPPSNELHMPMSPREEASKKLYEGLGIGRPLPSATLPPVPHTAPIRLSSQPTRHPRGPPSGADELGPKNFATRIRRQAIGGLNVLLESRERRDIEVY